VDALRSLHGQSAVHDEAGDGVFVVDEIVVDGKARDGDGGRAGAVFVNFLRNENDSLE